MDVQRLRVKTAAEHEAVEACMPLMKPDLTQADYIGCLQRMSGVVTSWEEQAAARAPQLVRSLLPARRRAHLLQQDLAWFGVAGTSYRPDLPALNDPASWLGAMYVMEGSTLGGQIIARHVQQALDLTPGSGSAFFCGHGRSTGSLWKEFCSVLQAEVSESDSDAVILGAKSMFRFFGAWMLGVGPQGVNTLTSAGAGNFRVDHDLWQNRSIEATHE